MVSFQSQYESEASVIIAQLMAVAAKTAPKSKGSDNIFSAVVSGEDINIIRNQMKSYGESKNIPFFIRDFKSTEHITAILLIGVQSNPLGLPDCGYCGFKNCNECASSGANCFFNVVDMGIALGSAVSSASTLKVDTRIMYSIGRAARDLKILPDRYNLVLGIPISVKSKSPFFDRES